MRIIIAFLLMAGTAFAINPDKPVAMETAEGDLYRFHQGIPRSWGGDGSYRNRGEAQWIKDGWLQVKVDRVTDSESYDKTVPDIEITPGVFISKQQHESEFLARCVPLLETIAPDRPGLETLALIQGMRTKDFIALAKARFAGRPTDQLGILAAVVEVLAIFQELKGAGYAWPLPADFGQAIGTREVERKVWVRVDN